ncbi:MAG: tyrosine-type recombinase/integrase [Candidatus Sumerlaeia bacterium]|nr:tyrosine-type recombinase/integrase [Candidatus Sumerlaeia bacterium]
MAKLTKSIIEATRPAAGKRVELWDDSLPGFGARVSARGCSFVLMHRGAAGEVRRLTLGKYPGLTVDAARKLAMAAKLAVAEGRDPGRERKARREAEASRETVAELWERVYADAGPRWSDSMKLESARRWRLFIGPALGALDVAAVKRSHVHKLHQSLMERPVQANRVLAQVRALFNVARDWGALEGENPAAGVRMYPETPRTVFLSGDQLRALLEAIREEEALGGVRAVERTGEAVPGVRGGKGLREAASRGIPRETASLFRLLAFTGARLSEILKAQWGFVDWAGSALRLPRSKTGAKVVWLNATAAAELRRLYESRNPASPWIIPGRGTAAPLAPPQKAWRRVRTRAAELFAARQATGEALDGDAETLRELHLHDLRHAAASFAVAAGVPLFAVGKVLGHSTPATTQRYAHAADAVARDAAEAMGAAMLAAMEARARVLPVAPPAEAPNGNADNGKAAGGA